MFLKSLGSGPKLAQYVTRLTLSHYAASFQPNASRSAIEANIKRREHKWGLLDALLLEAVPLMVSLRMFL